jgi:hypothetical protein
MTKRRQNENKSKRLAKGVSKDKKRAGAGRTRKGSLRAKHRGDTGRTVAHERNISPLVRLMGSFRAEKIQFQLIGMSAAVLQGVPVVTHDVDLWMDLPVRQYMKPINVALRLGAKMARDTVVELSDGMLVNFIFEVTGLKSFADELSKARRLKFHGMTIPVMPLESIRKSKAAAKRPKDEVHIFYIDQMLRLKRKTE